MLFLCFRSDPPTFPYNWGYGLRATDGRSTVFEFTTWLASPPEFLAPTPSTAGGCFVLHICSHLIRWQCAGDVMPASAKRIRNVSCCVGLRRFRTIQNHLAEERSNKLLNTFEHYYKVFDSCFDQKERRRMHWPLGHPAQLCSDTWNIWFHILLKEAYKEDIPIFMPLSRKI